MYIIKHGSEILEITPQICLVKTLKNGKRVTVDEVLSSSSVSPDYDFIYSYGSDKMYRKDEFETITIIDSNNLSFSQLKELKLYELSNACEQAIYQGATVNDEPFSYTLADQANISEMFVAVVSGATGYLYHADGKGCREYTAQEIIEIYSTLSIRKTSLLTYHNLMKKYINSLLEDTEENKEIINNIYFGQELPTAEYQEQYNTLVQKAQEQLQNILNKE